jgi:hypothetical protein
MSHTIVLELSDEDFAPIAQEASATGRTPAEIIVQRLRGHAASQQEPVREAETADALPQSSGPITDEDVQAAFTAVAQRIAAQTGRPSEEIVAEIRANLQSKPRPPLSEAERQAAWEQLMRYCGAVDSGDPHSADNERIDADLAREYGRGLDEDR